MKKQKKEKFEKHNTTIEMMDDNPHALWVQARTDEFAAKLAAGESYTDVRNWWEHEDYAGTLICDVLVEVRWRGLAPPKVLRGPALMDVLSTPDSEEQTTTKRRTTKKDRLVFPEPTWKDALKQSAQTVNVDEIDLSK
jgi:hypothetical protein